MPQVIGRPEERQRNEEIAGWWSNQSTQIYCLQSYMDMAYGTPKTIPIVTSKITDHHKNTIIHKKFKILQELPKCDTET